MHEYKVILSSSFFVKLSTSIKIPRKIIMAESLEDAWYQACKIYSKSPFVYVIEKEYVEKFKQDIDLCLEYGSYQKELHEEVIPHMYPSGSR